MQESLDTIGDAFSRTNRRPAVFDREMRVRHGLWTLRSPVSAADVVAGFKQHGAFTGEGAAVVVPLHEVDTAELTGEYLVYRPDQLVACVVYYDFSTGGFARIPLDEFGSTFPAWRVRFWLPAFDPPEPPSYRLEAIDVTDDVDAGTDAVSPRAERDRRESGEIVSELRGFVESQKEAERTEARARFARLPIEQFRRTAGAIPALVPAGIHVDEYGQQSVHLRVPTDDLDGPVDVPDEFGIYPGSEVLVGADGDLEGFPREAEVLEIEGRQLELGVYWNRNGGGGPREDPFRLESDHRFTVGELLNPVPFERQLDAIDAVGNDERKAGVLSGDTAPGFDSSLDHSVRKGRLNNYQYRAVQNALRATDVYCIHGPPGTGKTRTLVEIIETACAEGERVLACAQSNQAVDNLLVGDSTLEEPDESSLHAAAVEGDLTVARAGNNSTSDLVREEYEGADLYQSDVVCATTSGAARFGTDIFDRAVLDEATQATVPSSLIPFSRAKRLVLAGDHKQLPPYHSTEGSEEETVGVSLFEQLLETYGDDLVTTLRTQYRMNQEIARFPNETFYGGRLTHGVRNRVWSLSVFPPLEAYQVSGEEQTTPGNSTYNEAEVAVVVEEIERMLDRGIASSSIGVITPYTGQASKIRGALHRATVDGATDVEVDTVDSYQGSERDAIVISFVRSNPQGFSGFLTFPDEGPRRLNVALTRARKRCVLVGDFETLATRAPNRSEDGSAAWVYRALQESLADRDLLSTPGHET